MRFAHFSVCYSKYSLPLLSLSPYHFVTGFSVLGCSLVFKFLAGIFSAQDLLAGKWYILNCQVTSRNRQRANVVKKTYLKNITV